MLDLTDAVRPAIGEEKHNFYILHSDALCKCVITMRGLLTDARSMKTVKHGLLQKFGN